ncbi:MAG: cobalt-precorrin-5B (C(1))-methyltransferase CbiD [Thermotogota bacterium]|nr:cobalt-precorrin-5B (C(1))-methyltransferase CbiD [Thermotogota bacterium]
MKLRKGFTTGAAATAALKASLLYQLGNQKPTHVSIILPGNQLLDIKIHKYQKTDGKYYATVKKDAGDDADITDGCEVSACCQIDRDAAKSISFNSDFGVGTVTAEGLGIKVGEPAINQVPREMMKRVLRDFNIPSAKITINVENGETLAKSTLNHKVGVKGGISILGTTGIVEPMSEQAWKESLLPQMDVLKAKGFQKAVLVLGGLGEKRYINLFGPTENTIICGNYFGYAIQNLKEKGFNEIAICGAFQKIIKLSGGNFNTDSRHSDSKHEIMALYYTMLANEYEKVTVQTILNAKPFSSVMQILRDKGVDIKKLFALLARGAIDKLDDFFNTDTENALIFRIVMLEKETILVDYKKGSLE